MEYGTDGDMSTDQQETDQRDTLQPDLFKNNVNFKMIYFNFTGKNFGMTSGRIITYSEPNYVFKTFILIMYGKACF